MRKRRHIVKDLDELNRMHRHLVGVQNLAFDTETDSTERNRQGVGYSFGTEDEGWYCPFGHVLLKETDKPVVMPNGQMMMDRAYESYLDPANLPKEAVLDVVRDLMRYDKVVRAHNWKFDIGTMRRDGLEPLDIMWVLRDTMMASFVVNPDQRHGMKPLTWKYLKYKQTEFDELLENLDPKVKRILKMMGTEPNGSHIPISQMGPYSVDDVILLFPLERALEAQMSTAQKKVYRELESPFPQVLEQMEQEGMLLDTDFLAELDQEFKGEMVTLQREAAISAGFAPEKFKITSTQWLSINLIERPKTAIWGVKPEWEQGKSGHYSTADGIIEEIADSKVPGTTASGVKVAHLIRQYRRRAKLCSTYTLPLAAQVDEGSRVHSDFMQHGTRTGRFSSSGPNLQNIPIRTEEGRRIREAFIAEPGYVFFDVDYSQIELRVMAHFSRDPVMLDVYRNDGDIHQRTADSVGCGRQDAKSLNFGLFYGLAAKSFARQYGFDIADAVRWRASFFDTYSGVDYYLEVIRATARKNGYTSTILGRRRYLPGIDADDFKTKGSAERIAVNTKIQGSAADIIKIAMRNIYREFRNRNWIRHRIAWMTAQVHDELTFQVKESEKEEVAHVVRSIMESAVQLRVPLKAEPKWGPNWLEAH